MSDVKHMNAEDDDKQELVTDITNPRYGLPVEKIKPYEDKTPPPRTLFIVDEASGIDDDKVDVSAWASRVVEITTPLQPSPTFAKPEFTPEAYSIDNITRVAKNMEDKRREVDCMMRDALTVYTLNDQENITKFCEEMHISITTYIQIMSDHTPIPTWFYDRLKVWTKSKEKPQ